MSSQSTGRFVTTSANLRNIDLIVIAILLSVVLGGMWIGASQLAERERDRGDELLDGRVADHRRQMLPLLESLRTADAANKVIVMGNSLEGAGFGSHETLTAGLTSTGLDIAALNLALPGGNFDTYEPLLDDFWRSEVDWLIVNPAIFRPRGTATTQSLLRRQIQRIRAGTSNEAVLIPSSTINADLCRQGERSSQALSREVTKVTTLFSRPIDEDAAASFLAQAEQLEIGVMFVVTPRSSEFADELGRSASDRLSTAAEIAREWDHVVAAPDVGTFPLDQYCDYSHLNASGAAEFRTLWIAAAHPVLASD